jgi:ribosomal protein L4
MRSFEVKVNKKARHAALRSALSDHAANGTLGVLSDAVFTEPSTPTAAALVAAWGQELPLLVIAREDEVTLIKSFRNLERVLVTVPGELKTVAVVWARAILVTEGALPLVEGRAS